MAADAALTPASGGARARGGAVSDVASDALALEFEALVQDYPFGCDDGRTEAEKVFKRHRAKGVPFEAIIAGARRLAEHVTAAGTPRRYVPLLKNWLWAKRWTDKLKAPEASRKSSKPAKAAKAAKAAKGNNQVESTSKPDLPSDAPVRHRLTGKTSTVMDCVDMEDGRYLVSVVESGVVAVYPAHDLELVAESKPKGKVGKSVWSRDTGSEGVLLDEKTKSGSRICKVRWLESGNQDWYFCSDLQFTKPVWDI